MTSGVINVRYEILERLGEDELFSSLKTRDKVIGRVAVVKTLNSSLARDPEFCSALRTSAARAVDLVHPHIARLYDIGEEDGVPYLVTEFVRGIDLKERVRRIAPFTLSVAVDFAIAMGDALQYAHGAGSIHGDLRPQHVMVSPEGTVKIGAFGIAAAIFSSTNAREAVQEVAAPYTAPEVRGGVHRTYASDIYGLGAILFEMLTASVPGQAGPLSSGSGGETILSPRALNPGVPRSLDSIVEKSLNPDPAARYTSIADFLTDLKGVRDALRFGKPLTWTPTDGAAAPMVAAPQPRQEPVKESIDRKESARMPQASVADDGLSPFLKFMLAGMSLVVLVIAVAGIAIWMTTFSKPPDVAFPNLVGMKLSDARAAADKANVRLLEHEEYNDKFDAGVIWRTDYQAGRAIRPGRSVNIWVSKGSRMVWVPDVVKATAQEAEEKLKGAGLGIGLADRKYSSKIAANTIISQNPRAGKHVNRDTLVNLEISDGPDPNIPIPDTSTADTGSDQRSGQENASSGTQPNTSTEPDTTDLEPRFYDLKIKIKRDHKGDRRVKVEYDDALGTHVPIDEMHGEGDEVRQRVEVAGGKITIRVYYGDDPNPVAEDTRNLPRKPSER